jgi:hypothetical protein
LAHRIHVLVCLRVVSFTAFDIGVAFIFIALWGFPEEQRWLGPAFARRYAGSCPALSIVMGLFGVSLSIILAIWIWPLNVGISVPFSIAALMLGRKKPALADARGSLTGRVLGIVGIVLAIVQMMLAFYLAVFTRVK